MATTPPTRSSSRVFAGKRFHATDAAFSKRSAQTKAAEARRGGRLARISFKSSAGRFIVSPRNTKVYIVWTRIR